MDDFLLLRPHVGGAIGDEVVDFLSTIWPTVVIGWLGVKFDLGDLPCHVPDFLVAIQAVFSFGDGLLDALEEESDGWDVEPLGGAHEVLLEDFEEVGCLLDEPEGCHLACEDFWSCLGEDVFSPHSHLLKNVEKLWWWSWSVFPVCHGSVLFSGEDDVVGCGVDDLTCVETYSLPETKRLVGEKVK